MIYLYVRKLRDSTRKSAEEWLLKREIPYRIVSSKDVTEEFVRKLLSLTMEGTEELLVSKHRKGWNKLGLLEEEINQLELSSFIKLLVENPDLLKSPIVFSNKKLMAGYNADEIRTFISSEYRDVKRKIVKEEK